MLRAAHRLDSRRVRGFPDWAVHPGEVGGWCLGKIKEDDNLTAALSFTEDKEHKANQHSL